MYSINERLDLIGEMIHTRLQPDLEGKLKEALERIRDVEIETEIDGNSCEHCFDEAQRKYTVLKGAYALTKGDLTLLKEMVNESPNRGKKPKRI